MLTSGCRKTATIADLRHSQPTPPCSVTPTPQSTRHPGWASPPCARTTTPRPAAPCTHLATAAAAAAAPVRGRSGHKVLPWQCLARARVGNVHDSERYFPAFNLPAYPPENGSSSSSSSSSSARIRVSSSGSGFPGAVGSPVTVWEEPRATVHVTTGAGGNSEMRVGPDLPPQVQCGPLRSFQMPPRCCRHAAAIKQLCCACAALQSA